MLRLKGSHSAAGRRLLVRLQIRAIIGGQRSEMIVIMFHVQMNIRVIHASKHINMVMMEMQRDGQSDEIVRSSHGEKLCK